MLNAFLNLAVRTVTEPRSVAAELLAMRLDRTMLMMALGLAVVLNTIVYQLSLLAAPPTSNLPILFTSALIFALFIGLGLVLSIVSVTYAGRFLGGKATLEGIMTLIAWLQFLRFGLQLVTFVLMPIIPGLVGLLALCATLYGMWLLLQFIDVAHEFYNLFTSFGALVLAGLGIMLGLALAISLLGVQNMGLTPYV
ncbi:hypothetical protein [Planktotalea sp.]|uniref:hypothetical protein n=1 Tax=Planktotalea sp. TaxID=2029877 RepID=UPI0025E7F256|nr:hypothetical protein [Planktotalea sp.]